MTAVPSDLATLGETATPDQQIQVGWEMVDVEVISHSLS
jgi:hypothetical protein